MTKRQAKSHLEVTLEILQELKINVTTEDRTKAMKKLGISKGSISKYLNGKGQSADTAAKLIAFLKKQIAAREKKFK